MCVFQKKSGTKDVFNQNSFLVYIGRGQKFCELYKVWKKSLLSSYISFSTMFISFLLRRRLKVLWSVRILS